MLILTFLGSISSGELDIDKVDLELPVGLDTNEQGRTSSSGNDLVGEVLRLEDERKGTFLRAVAEAHNGISYRAFPNDLLPM